MKPVRPLCYMICGPDGAFYRIPNILIILTKKRCINLFHHNRPLQLVCLVFLIQVMWQHSRELFLSDFVLFTCICTHNLWKDKGSSSPGTSIGKTKHTPAKEVYLPTENKGASNINYSIVVLYLMFAALHNQSPLITMSRYTGYYPSNEVEVDTEQ